MGSLISGNNTEYDYSLNDITKFKSASMQGEVDIEILDQVDDYGHYLGTVIMVYNNLSSSVYVKVVFKENGKKQHVVIYVGAEDSKRAWYGNQTLKVVWDECYWDYSPIIVDPNSDY